MKTLLIVVGILIAWLVLGFFVAIVFGKFARHGNGEDLEPGDLEPTCNLCQGGAADCTGRCLKVQK